MSFQDPKTWKNYSGMQKCWVPNCLNSRTNGYTKNLFLLPVDMKYRELWIAMAGKKLAGSQEIYFCQDHFVPEDMEVVMNQALYLKRTAIPYDNMPQKVCRTCMSLIGRNESFSILSRNIPSAMPTDTRLNLPQCRPEPLYQILTFCIPDLNLQPDPPPLVCSQCYQNIWLYFVYKISCNAVEKGLRGNLTPEEYGKMVLCRTCPQTSGTSFFVLAEDTLMGSLLKKMFINEFPSDVVPLKVCLRCWNTLYKLKNFYEQCMAVDQKLQRHILLNQTGLGSISQYPATVPTPLDTPNATASRLRDVRKSNYSHRNNDTSLKNDMAYPQVIDQDMSCVSVADSITKPPPNDNVKNSVFLPNNSVIKFTGSSHVEKKESNSPPPDVKEQIKIPETHPLQAVNYSATNKEAENGVRPSSQQQEQHDFYKRAYTWVPPLPNTKPVIFQKTANTWVPPIINTQNAQSTSFQGKPNTRASFPANLQSATQPVTVQERASARVTSDTQSIPVQKLYNLCALPVANPQSNTENYSPDNTGTCNNALQKNVSVGEIGDKYKPLKNAPDDTIRHKKLKPRFLPRERIALAQLMIKYGEPLLSKTNPEAQFDAWIKVVKEFHKINNKWPLESIQNMWNRMKAKAGLAFTHIGPSEYEDQLVINYMYSYPCNTDVIDGNSTVNVSEEDSDIICLDSDDNDIAATESTVNRNEDDIICLDDEMSNVNENVTNKRKISEVNTGSGASSSKIPVGGYSAEHKTPLSSSQVVNKRKRGRPKRIPVNEKLESSQEIKKDRDKGMKNNILSSTELTKRKKRRGRPKVIAKMKEWGHKQNLELVRAIRKEYDKSLKNNELNSGKSPWKMLIKRLSNGKYNDCPFDKLYYLWSKIKLSATIYEKNGNDLVDEEVWELLQTQNAVQKSLIKKSAMKDSTIVQNNKSQTSSENSNTENRTPVSSTEKSGHSESCSSPNHINNDSGSGSTRNIPASTSNSETSKNSTTGNKKDLKASLILKPEINANSTKDCNKNFQHWTEDEKLEFFKLIKQEYNSMVKNREPIARPWHKIIQRIASRGYKNYKDDVLFSSWHTLRQNATLHENSGKMTMLDCKVLRLLKLANKLKNIKAPVKIVKNKDDQRRPNVTPHSNTIIDKNVNPNANSKTTLSRNEHKKTSRAVTNERNQNVYKAAATPHDDEDDADDKNNSYKNWTLKEKLHLVDKIKSYGSEVFKKNSRGKKFWYRIVDDHKAKGYKRNKAQVTGYWYYMLKSAKLAWAQQKETSQVDKSIIDFMMEVIGKRGREGECSNEAKEDGDSSDDELSDRMDELSNNPENEESDASISCTEDSEANKKSAHQEDPDDDDGLNYDYVSLEDLENDCEENIVPIKIPEPAFKIESYMTVEDTTDAEPEFKAEPSYLSMEGATAEPEFKTEPSYVSMEDATAEPEFKAEPSYVSMEDTTAELECKVEPLYVSMEDCAVEAPPIMEREQVIIIDDSEED